MNEEDITEKQRLINDGRIPVESFWLKEQPSDNLQAIEINLFDKLHTMENIAVCLRHKLNVIECMLENKLHSDFDNHFILRLLEEIRR